MSVRKIFKMILLWQFLNPAPRHGGTISFMRPCVADFWKSLHPLRFCNASVSARTLTSLLMTTCISSRISCQGLTWSYAKQGSLIYIYIYTHTHVHILYTHTDTYIYLYIYIYIYIYILYIHTCIDIRNDSTRVEFDGHIHTYRQTYIHTYTYTCTPQPQSWTP